MWNFSTVYVQTGYWWTGYLFLSITASLATPGKQLCSQPGRVPLEFSTVFMTAVRLVETTALFSSTVLPPIFSSTTISFSSVAKPLSQPARFLFSSQGHGIDTVNSQWKYDRNCEDIAIFFLTLSLYHSLEWPLPSPTLSLFLSSSVSVLISTAVCSWRGFNEETATSLNHFYRPAHHIPVRHYQRNVIKKISQMPVRLQSWLSSSCFSIKLFLFSFKPLNQRYLAIVPTVSHHCPSIIRVLSLSYSTLRHHIFSILFVNEPLSSGDEYGAYTQQSVYCIIVQPCMLAG